MSLPMFNTIGLSCDWICALYEPYNVSWPVLVDEQSPEDVCTDTSTLLSGIGADFRLGSEFGVCPLRLE
jgi:hypothetical protein